MHLHDRAGTLASTIILMGIQSVSNSTRCNELDT